MTIEVLVDTGPLVAMLDASDGAHSVCVETLSFFRTPLVTTWPVLTEAAWILRNRPDLVQRLIRSAAAGFLRIEIQTDVDASAMAAIFDRYADQHFQLADVSLMHLADRKQIDTVFTLDRRDFGIFRTHQGKPLNLLPQT